MDRGGLRAVGGDQDSRLLGGYVLEERVGAGAMGVVWRARRVSGGGVVAVKVLKEELTGDDVLVERFLRERRALLQVSGQHVATLLDLVVQGDMLALVTEYLPGGDLRSWLDRHGPQPPGRAAFLAAQVFDGLASVHRAGIVHRDVKPGNVLLRGGDGVVELLLSDFGVVRLADQATLTVSRAWVGTPHYLAPELAAGERATPAADMYSTGILLYELLAGTPPFTGEHLMAVVRAHADQSPPPIHECPDVLWQLVASLLAKNPDDRPTSAAGVSDLLHTIARGHGNTTPQPAVAPVLPLSHEVAAQRQQLAVLLRAWRDKLAHGTARVDRIRRTETDRTYPTEVAEGATKGDRTRGTQGDRTHPTKVANATTNAAEPTHGGLARRDPELRPPGSYTSSRPRQQSAIPLYVRLVVLVLVAVAGIMLGDSLPEGEPLGEVLREAPENVTESDKAMRLVIAAIAAALVGVWAMTGLVRSVIELVNPLTLSIDDQGIDVRRGGRPVGHEPLVAWSRAKEVFVADKYDSVATPTPRLVVRLPLTPEHGKAVTRRPYDADLKGHVLCVLDRVGADPADVRRAIQTHGG